MPELLPDLRPRSLQLLDILLDGERSLTELAKVLELSKPTVHTHLQRLVDANLVTKRKVTHAAGREARYALRPASLHLEVDPDRGTAISWSATGFVSTRFPLVNQVPQERPRRDLHLVLEALEEGLAPGTWEGVLLLVYGSVARGEANAASDLDLAILPGPNDEGATLEDEVHRALGDVETRLEHPIRLRLIDKGTLLAADLEYHRDILHEALVLHAPPHEVELWKNLQRYKRTST